VRHVGADILKKNGRRCVLYVRRVGADVMGGSKNKKNEGVVKNWRLGVCYVVQHVGAGVM